LKKQKATHPNARRATKPGKDVLTDEQLNLKKEKSAGKNGQADQVVVKHACAFSERISIPGLVLPLANDRHCVMFCQDYLP
jgi:hypothetical protein